MSEERKETGKSESVFDCCGANMDDVATRCPCGIFMRRRPVVTSLFIAAMGLVALLVPTGAILGIIAFFRTI